jgi:hypothetical protein
MREASMSAQETRHDRAILDHAERMWREDGCPPGRMDEYLERARELQAIVDNPGAGQLPNPMVTHPGGVEPAQPVEEAALQENLGEFPGRLTDQGDRRPTPMTRRAELDALKKSE